MLHCAVFSPGFLSSACWLAGQRFLSCRCAHTWARFHWWFCLHLVLWTCTSSSGRPSWSESQLTEILIFKQKLKEVSVWRFLFCYVVFDSFFCSFKLHWILSLWPQQKLTVEFPSAARLQPSVSCHSGLEPHEELRGCIAACLCGYRCSKTHLVDKFHVSVFTWFTDLLELWLFMWHCLVKKNVQSWSLQKCFCLLATYWPSVIAR